MSVYPQLQEYSKRLDHLFKVFLSGCAAVVCTRVRLRLLCMCVCVCVLVPACI
jgi:hypothetical protein